MFQSAYEEAHKAIIKNYTELKLALKAGERLTSHQQATIQSAVTTIHKQLEKFACCTTAPPFLISPSGHWTQDSRSTADVLKQLVSMYTYNPDQQNEKPFWQRIFGFRRLLASTPSPPVTSQHMGKGRFWGSRSISPSPVMPIPPQHGTAGTAGRPTLMRQNAFKLSEEESQALTQQLGISSHGHSGSGHDLLSEGSKEAAEEDESAAARQSNSTATGGLDGVLSSVGGSLKGALFGEAAQGAHTSTSAGPDLHQPFNATAAYANVTRCNPKRWVALHTSGASRVNMSHNLMTAVPHNCLTLLCFVAVFEAKHSSCNNCMVAKHPAIVNSIQARRTEYLGLTALALYLQHISCNT